MSFVVVIIIIIGKFQMQVLPQCGHAVHEDAPEKVCLFYITVIENMFASSELWYLMQVADALATFMVRHKFTEFKEGFPW